MELCGGKRKVGGIVWWEEKGRWNCVIAWWEVKGRWNCVIAWWEEKGRWDCVVGRER